MYLYDFSVIQESIVCKYRERFIFDYCMLKEIIILPELVTYVLHFIMHKMINKLHQFVDDQKYLISSVIFVLKHAQQSYEKSYNFFGNDVVLENLYNEAAHNFYYNKSNNHLQEIVSLSRRISTNSMTFLLKSLYTICCNMSQKYYYNNVLNKLLDPIVYKDIRLKTRNKHFQHLIVNKFN